MGTKALFQRGVYGEGSIVVQQFCLFVSETDIAVRFNNGGESIM